jgi:SSS family solute:Na+ symporter
LSEREDFMPKTMQALDWAVMGAYAVGMLAVGWYFSCRVSTKEEYMLGGRRMKPWTVGLSLFATLFSAISYLSSPGEMIRYGPMMWCYMLSYPVIYVVVGWLIIPAFMNAKVTSAYELLDIRLGPSLRTLASVIFLVIRITWMAVITYVCAEKIIIPIMGWPENSALWISIVMAVITTIYTSMGGLQAVVWTDVIQSFILFGAAVVTVVMINISLGSPLAWLPARWPENWLHWTLFDPSARVTFLSTFMSGSLWWICTSASDQMAVQRYLATKDISAARKMLMYSLISDCAVGIFLALIGLSVLAYFIANPALLPQGQTITTAADRLFPHFIVIGLPPGVTGLVIAGLFAAAMSSLASGINSSCLVISRDFIDRFGGRRNSESRQVLLDKILSIIIGAVFVLLSLFVSRVKGNLLEISSKTINLLVAPLFIPFMMALFVRGATELGTFIGTLASIVIAVIISFSDEMFGKQISFLWIMPCSLLGGFFISYAMSLLCRGCSVENLNRHA